MLEQLIMARVDKRLDGCWQWTGGKNSGGYGYIYHDRKMKRVHKVLWEIHNPIVPKGMHLDHLCRNKACCNLDHLEVVTHAENLRRGNRGGNGYEKKTHCPQGHPYSVENTRFYKSGRVCKECGRIRCRSEHARAYNRRRYHAKKQEA